jgi:putative hydroxymethylpyrimidine transport system ATP-binding protein
MSQLPTLVPWLSVLDNLCLRQRLDGTAPDQRTRAIELLDRVGLISIAMAYPHTLSVGMQQRICLLRTVLQDKPVVLLDEPFSALDHDTRVDLQNLLVQLLPTAAILMVTHDWLDVLRLAHVVYTLKGRPARLMPVAIALPDHPVPRPVPLDALPFLAAEQKRPQPSSAGVAL